MLQELSETKTALETSTSESLHQAELAEVVRQKGQFMKRNAELQQINGKVQSTLEIQTQELRSLQFIYEELQMRYRHLEAKSEKLRAIAKTAMQDVTGDSNFDLTDELLQEVTGEETEIQGILHQSTAMNSSQETSAPARKAPTKQLSTKWMIALGKLGAKGGEGSGGRLRKLQQSEMATQTDESSLEGGNQSSRPRKENSQGLPEEDAEDKVTNYVAFKNPLRKIVKNSKAGAKMPLPKVLGVIADVYTAKAIEDATAEREGKPYDTLPMFLEDFFLRKVLRS